MVEKHMQAAPRYEVYDQFAWFYARGWGQDFHAQARGLLENHVFPRLRAAARVLDLCCGSGDLSRELLAHGYQVTGLDGSPEMLRYARQRVPRTEFLLEDARSFACEARFDAVLSTYDSLNHILSLEELEAVFANVFRALVPGGLFFFDLNMEEAFATNWHWHYATVEEDTVGVTRTSYDPAAKTGRADVTLFRLEEGVWRRSDVVVLERCYEREEVTGGLARAGFVEVQARPAWELGMGGDSAVGREFFGALKPRLAE
jgi:SAM-dependent methyltransferase